MDHTLRNMWKAVISIQGSYVPSDCTINFCLEPRSLNLEA